MKTTKIVLTSIKDSDAFNRACHELDIDREIKDKFFEFGEYADIELEVNSNLDIVSAKFLKQT